MKEIQLTKGKVALVDDADFDILNMFVWHAQKSKNTFYAERKETILGKRVQVSMHRMIMGAKAGEFIDHKDRNGLNNQKSNLRLCNLSQNGANKKPRGTSKYMGVSLSNRKYKNKAGIITITPHWQAVIQINEQQKFLGYFKIEEDAARAYNKAAIEIHGEFANLNDIPNLPSIAVATYDTEIEAIIIQ